jgi:hypothetical protein
MSMLGRAIMKVTLRGYVYEIVEYNRNFVFVPINWSLRMHRKTGCLADESDKL